MFITLRKNLTRTLSKARRAPRRTAQRGMTLLEIMIVLAILALVMGLVVGPRVMKAFGQSKNDIAKLTAKKFTAEAFPLWQGAHPGKGCPDKLEELNEWADSKDGKDPWGTPWKMFCGGDVPAGVKSGLAVQSAGENQKFDDADDVKSWD
ncbi:MAG: type II secretion system protein [Proteobacteria bacterium]|nr:type II secretion system protein [Pseudomonadota bacterium]